MKQRRNKKHIDRTRHSEEVNERWGRRRRRGGQGGKQKEEAGLNPTLSMSRASPPGCAFNERMHEAEGLMAIHAGRGPASLWTASQTQCDTVVHCECRKVMMPSTDNSQTCQLDRGLRTEAFRPGVNVT